MPNRAIALCAPLVGALIAPAGAFAQAGEKADPAGGAAIGEVVLATAMAGVVTAIALVVVIGHRSGRVKFVGRAAAYSEKLTGVPGWASLPNVFVGGALLIAVIGMYWDISLHIDNGRDPGPLANPAHYLILFGLFGIFVAGLLSMALPEPGVKPSSTAVRLQKRLVRAARRRADDRLRRLRARRLPARRRLAPAVRPGRDAVGPDAPDADRRRLAGDAGRRDPDRRGRARLDQVRPRAEPELPDPAPRAARRRLPRRPLDRAGRVRLLGAAVPAALPPRAADAGRLDRARLRADLDRPRRRADGGLRLPGDPRPADRARRAASGARRRRISRSTSPRRPASRSSRCC